MMVTHHAAVGRPPEFPLCLQFCRGWVLLGSAAAAALASAAALALLLRGEGDRFNHALGAAACAALGFALIFFVAFPVKKATSNWTRTPEGWKRLRRRWEYSHAASAVLYLAALALLLLGRL